MDQDGNIDVNMWLRLHSDLTAEDVDLFHEMRHVHATQQAAESLYDEAKRAQGKRGSP